MTFDPDAVETVAFDSYGTIVDVTTVEEPLGDYVDDPSALAALWRERSLTYAMVGNAIGEYHAFFDLIEHALEYALAARGVDLSRGEKDDLLATYHDLDVFGDVHEGLDRLRAGGYDCYVVSNGNQEMLDSLVEFADLAGRIERTFSADDVERFKPEQAIYRHAAEEIGTPVENVAFAAAGWWDVPGAVNAGMQGVWVNRQQTRWGPYETEPHLTVSTFTELADELGV
jgi:2-haloacid dehalogenase